jgi:hypothetical protein
MLPFTREQFFAVFVAYNDAIWPAQLVAYGLGLVAVALLIHPSRFSDRAIAGVLAAMWTWTGIAYHWLYFSPVNKPALAFGALFVAEGAGFGYAAMLRHRLRFRFEPGPAAWLAGFLVAYAAILYPLIGLSVGHGFAETPAFGVTPCPLTIFTLGMLLLAAQRVPLWLLAVPFVWSLIGGSAAILLGIPQDWMLLASGLIAVPAILLCRSGTRREAASKG